jgi:hypothetical protein
VRNSMSVPELEKISFPQNYASALVESGETKDVLTINVDASGGYTAFLERIACDWFGGSNPPDTRSILELVIDGVPRRFEYEIQINKPYIFNPPFVARHTIVWRVTNNDVPHIENGVQKTGAHWYGVLCDGVFAKPKP